MRNRQRRDMRSSLVIGTSETAWFQPSPWPHSRAVVHSDRSSQYASRDFRAVLKKHGISASMSRGENCLENAPTKT
jgi:transposase InsO family protein